MRLNALFSYSTVLNLRAQGILTRRYFATTTKKTEDEFFDITTVDETPIYIEELKTEDDMHKRNKSRLNPQHRNIIHGTRPFDKGIEWYHKTTKYKKRMLGRFGMKGLDVTAGVAWPTEAEVEKIKEYEKVAYPETIQELWAKIDKKNAKEVEAIRAREEEIARNLLKLDYWKSELAARLAKKEAQALEIKKRKEHLVEVVRRHFGFKVDPRSTKFKEMLEQKELEEKKRSKQAKKKANEEKMMARLLKANATIFPTESSGNKPEAAEESKEKAK